ncbi:hypothetical protein DARTUKUTA_38 [Bacillus phage vB_BspP_Dartukuta]|nr:hypothetical protein DARTUKUTA_38 [Bacillus phage vB_BspP_Dartukuta]
MTDDCTDCGTFARSAPADYDYSKALDLLNERVDMTDEQRDLAKAYLDKVRDSQFKEGEQQ